MSDDWTEIDLVVRREAEEPIALEEWLQYLRSVPELRHRTEGYVGRNPATGANITIPSGEGDSELTLENFTVPFLAFSDGVLTGRFYLDATNAQDPQRQRIADVGRHFRAVITLQYSNEPLDW